MSLLQRFFKGPQIHPAWTFSPSGIVWRLLFNRSGVIVGENRLQEQKQTTFFALDEQTGRCVWTYVPPGESWWLGLEAVSEKVALIHGYASPDMPEHRGLTALSMDDGRELWQNADVTYWFHSDERIYAVKTLFERRIGLELDMRTGELLAEYREGLEDLVGIRQSVIEQTQTPGFTFPEPLRAMERPEWVHAFVKSKQTGSTTVGENECFVKDGLLCISLYSRTKGDSQGNPLYQNRLLISTESGRRVIHEDLIDTAARYPVPDSFFAKDAQLFYVRDGRTLVALRPWKG